MRILVTGATGFGSAALARLREEGHDVVAVVRTHDRSASRLPATEVLAIDIARAISAGDWLPHRCRDTANVQDVAENA
jgi:nucleoside-diphosphate-sugar epimerase